MKHILNIQSTAVPMPYVLPTLILEGMALNY